jgi:flagellar hook assembly protein FlgD
MTDCGLEPGKRYHYKVIVEDLNGFMSFPSPLASASVQVEDGVLVKANMCVAGENRKAEVHVLLTAEAAVKMTVYAQDGLPVRSLNDGPMPQGVNKVSWDGKDDAGNPAATGVYFLNIRTGAINEWIKIGVKQ